MYLIKIALENINQFESQKELLKDEIITGDPKALQVIIYNFSSFNNYFWWHHWIVTMAQG